MVAAGGNISHDEKRRRHDDELEAEAAELAWRPAVVAAAVAAVVAAAAVERQRSAIRIASIFGEKRPILCVTEKTHTKKAIPISVRGLPELISKSGSPRIDLGFIPIWGPT
jgi:hypothetical protein